MANLMDALSGALAGANAGQTAGTLPLQNTGVPQAVQQQQAAPSPSQSAAPADNLNFSAPANLRANQPEPLPNQPGYNEQYSSILAALAGLVGNAWGIAQKSGAMGNQAMDVSKQLEASAQNKKAQAAQLSKQATDISKKQDEGKALYNQAASEIKDPLVLARIKAAVESNDTSGAEKALSDYRADRRFESRDKTYSDAMFKWQVGQDSKSAGELIKTVTGAAGDLQSKLDPSVGKAIQVETTLSQLNSIPKDAATLQILYNQNSGKGSPKLSIKEAQSIFDNQVQPAIQSARGGVNIPLIGNILGKSDEQLKPSEVFNGYAAKQFAPEIVQAYAQTKQSVDALKAHANEIKAVQANLSNPLKRGEALQQLRALQSQAMDGGSSSGGAPAAPAPAAQPTVKVISPDGKSGMIPAANLQKALKSGYKQAN